MQPIPSQVDGPTNAGNVAPDAVRVNDSFTYPSSAVSPGYSLAAPARGGPTTAFLGIEHGGNH